jgi:tight adherence protein B
MILVFAVLLSLAVAAGVLAIALNLRGAGARAVADRLRRLAPRIESTPTLQVERDSRYSSMPWLDRLLRGLDVGPKLELLLYQAGLRMRVGMLVILTACGAIGGYLFGLALFHRIFPGLVFMALLAPAPYLFVLFKKGQRMRAFTEHFPDALDLLVGGLRAGLSFNAAMQMVAQESPEPVCSEFSVAVEEQALGLDMREAMENMTRRVDRLDLRFFVTAVLLQRETGGNLAEVLSNSAALIRDRFRVMGDIKTFTAQGKMTAGILVALPIGVAAFTYMVTPGYFAPMLVGPEGRLALWLAFGLQLLGLLVIVKIVNIKV